MGFILHHNNFGEIRDNTDARFEIELKRYECFRSLNMGELKNVMDVSAMRYSEPVVVHAFEAGKQEENNQTKRHG